MKKKTEFTHPIEEEPCVHLLCYNHVGEFDFI